MNSGEKIYIVCSKYFDLNGEKKVIGGIETYIYMLTKVIKEIGIEIIIYQFGNKEFYIEEDGVKIGGIKVNKGSSLREKKNKIKSVVCREFNNEKDILLFATDYMNFKTNFSKTISIQHGVAWDITKNRASELENIFTIIRKMIGAVIKYKRYKSANKMVCVDYNFLNWYRTQISSINKQEICIIPNVPQKNEYVVKKIDSKIKIIFARRLVEYRGTEIFTRAIIPLLEKYKDIQVTIAGEGPEEKAIRQRLSKYEQVEFIKYDVTESLKIHSEMDIAIVPTVGSEGTSLSLLEAMSCECAVIGSNVGGITNILLDRYNGLIINPHEEELKEAIEELILKKELRLKLATNAKKTVDEGFAKDKWENAWKKVILDFYI